MIIIERTKEVYIKNCVYTQSQREESIQKNIEL